MSKSLGNVIDPLDTIKEFGTDALRFTVALGTAGQVSFTVLKKWVPFFYPMRKLIKLLKTMM